MASETLQLALAFEGMPANDQLTLAKAARGLRRWEARNRRQLAIIREQQNAVEAIRAENRKHTRRGKRAAVATDGDGQ